jgi:NADH:ubiquinone oxidoreductase subunit 4 (subunit M)
MVTLVPLVLLVVLVGVYPNVVLDLFGSSMAALSDAMASWKTAGL